MIRRRFLEGSAPHPDVPSKGAETVLPAAYEGATTGVQDGAITGWVWDASHPYKPLEIELYVGDVLVGQGTANLFDVGLAKANRGNGMHGFEVRLDRLPAKSPPFVIRVVVAGTEMELLPQ